MRASLPVLVPSAVRAQLVQAALWSVHSAHQQALGDPVALHTAQRLSFPAQAHAVDAVSPQELWCCRFRGIWRVLQDLQTLDLEGH